MDQVFYNELNSSAEAVFIFPLPENATITELVYWVNGVRYVAEVKEKAEAVAEYNQRLQQWLDPALLEYLGDNLFRLKIVPVNPLSEIRTEITYAEMLNYSFGKVNYKFFLNTLELSSQPLNTVSISLNAQSEKNFKYFHSSSHQSSTASQITKVSDKEYDFFFGDENFFPSKDLKIEYETERNQIDFNVLTYTPSESDSIGDDSFYILWVTPPDTLTESEILPRDIVFTADVSSSMDGTRIQQLKLTLNLFLDLLEEGDKFNIITFGTNVQKFSNDLVNADQDNVAQAKTFVDQLYALGMTNISAALDSSLNQSYRDNAVNNMIFLTDGEPTIGEVNTEQIIEDVQNANSGIRIFSFGVGETISRSFLTNLSLQNNGIAEFIESDDEILETVEQHFYRISQPALTNIEIDLSTVNSWDIYPKIGGDLFYGSQLVQLGLYNKAGNFNITLNGDVKDDSVSFSKQVEFSRTPGGHSFVPRMWAIAKIENLLQLIEIHGESDELVDQIVELSLKFGILTPYTAMYVDPDDPNTANEPDEELPTEFSLAQNYPNPFNPETNIEFTIPSSSSNVFVEIKVYNFLGQLVKILVSESLPSGTHNVKWNGKNEAGRQMPSGIYIYTISAGNYTNTKKMILLR